jgi:NTP pyrophosphatase (non-canonical NTP hydrolase)
MGWHNKTPLEYLALICSEVGEAANECRGVTPSADFGEECADIILRTLDVMQQYRIVPSEAIEAKIAKNLAKGKKLGRLK